MSVERRGNALLAQLRAEHPRALHEAFAAVICNRCGLVARADTLDELVRSGALVDWQIGEEFGDHDYCPACK